MMCLEKWTHIHAQLHGQTSERSVYTTVSATHSSQASDPTTPLKTLSKVSVISVAKACAVDSTHSWGLLGVLLLGGALALQRFLFPLLIF